MSVEEILKAIDEAQPPTMPAKILRRGQEHAEVPAAIADEIASWRRVIGHGAGGDGRGLLRRAAEALWRVLEVNHTVAPHAHACAHQEVVDALHDCAVLLGIPDDDAQQIIVERKNDGGRPRDMGAAHQSRQQPSNGARLDASSAYPRKLPITCSAATLRTKVFEPIRYIVPRYLAEGLTILAGRPKIGKSWLMLTTALTVADGGSTLGQTCEQGDVLYLALEDNERRLQSRITKLLGFANEWPNRFVYATDWPRANDGGLEHIGKWIKTVREPRLIVVDILAMFRSPRNEKQSPYDADYAAMQGLQRLASDARVGIVVVHHLRKSGVEGDPFEKVSGTLALSGAADSVLILDRDASGATLYGRGRDVEEIETAVEFDRTSCRWRILGEASEVRRTSERTAIVIALQEAGGPLSPSDIADATKMPGANVRQLLGKMVQAGEIVKGSRGRYLHPSITPDHNDHKITNNRGDADDP